MILLQIQLILYHRLRFTYNFFVHGRDAKINLNEDIQHSDVQHT